MIIVISSKLNYAQFFIEDLIKHWENRVNMPVAILEICQ